MRRIVFNFKYNSFYLFFNWYTYLDMDIFEVKSYKLLQFILFYS